MQSAWQDRLLSWQIHLAQEKYRMKSGGDVKYPAGIIKMLDLRRPTYFSRRHLDLPWEKLDKVEELKKYK